VARSVGHLPLAQVMIAGSLDQALCSVGSPPLPLSLCPSPCFSPCLHSLSQIKSLKNKNKQNPRNYKSSHPITSPTMTCTWSNFSVYKFIITECKSYINVIKNGNLQKQDIHLLGVLPQLFRNRGTAPSCVAPILRAQCWPFHWFRETYNSANKSPLYLY